MIEEHTVIVTSILESLLCEMFEFSSDDSDFIPRRGSNDWIGVTPPREMKDRPKPDMSLCSQNKSEHSLENNDDNSETQRQDSNQTTDALVTHQQSKISATVTMTSILESPLYLVSELAARDSPSILKDKNSPPSSQNFLFSKEIQDTKEFSPGSWSCDWSGFLTTVNDTAFPITTSDGGRPITTRDFVPSKTVIGNMIPTTVSGGIKPNTASAGVISITAIDGELPTIDNDYVPPITASCDVHPITANDGVLPVTASNDALPITAKEDVHPITASDNVFPITASGDVLSIMVNDDVLLTTANDCVIPIKTGDGVLPIMTNKGELPVLIAASDDVLSLSETPLISKKEIEINSLSPPSKKPKKDYDKEDVLSNTETYEDKTKIPVGDEEDDVIPAMPPLTSHTEADLLSLKQVKAKLKLKLKQATTLPTQFHITSQKSSNDEEGIKMEVEPNIQESEIISNAADEFEDIDGEKESILGDEMKLSSSSSNNLWATLLNKPPRIGLSRFNRRIQSLHNVSVIVKSEE